MAISKLPYKTLEELVRKNLVRQEYKTTEILIKVLGSACKKGWLTRKELALICKGNRPGLNS